MNLVSSLIKCGRPWLVNIVAKCVNKFSWRHGQMIAQQVLVTDQNTLYRHSANFGIIRYSSCMYVIIILVCSLVMEVCGGGMFSFFIILSFHPCCSSRTFRSNHQRQKVFVHSPVWYCIIFQEGFSNHGILLLGTT